jgi:hypothetical protein
VPEKKKEPALDQAEAMRVPIRGVADEPVKVAAAAAQQPAAESTPAAPAAPMLVDVPVELPDVTPDPQPDDGRPAADAHKPDWVAWAIDRGVPSYEAWAMTLPELKKLEA